MASKDKAFYSKNTLNVSGNLLDLSSPKIMAILNVTDDSFYDGGRFLKEKDISKQAERLIDEGADIIDIGGYSSRPGSIHIEEHIEIERVLRGIKGIKNASKSIPISVDTFRANVAKEAIENGAGIINDISGGNLDKQMFKTISHYNFPYILMHMVGTPQNMTKNVAYTDILTNILDYFAKKLNELAHFGVKDVIIDVGFGFSKTTLQNYDLLNQLEFFRTLNSPLLAGISRKSMIYKILETNPTNALNGTTALHAISMLKGVSLFRVHDVKEMKEVLFLGNLIQ